jgi:hypothetical protein
MDQEHSQLSGITSEETLKPNSRRRLLKGLAAGAAGLGVLSLSATAMAQTSFPDTAIESQGGSAGYGVDASGGKAAVRLRPVSGGATGAPAVTGHEVGELYVDGNGSLFYSVKTNTTAVAFRKLASANIAAASATHLAPGTPFFFAAPDRFYDGRDTTGYFTNLKNAGGTVILNSNMLVNTDYTLTVVGFPGQKNSAASVVPAGATAIFGSLLIVAPGNATNSATVTKLFPSSVTEAQTSSTAFLFGAGGTAAPFNVPLNSDGTIKLRTTTVPASGGGIVVDIAGYYL